MKSESLLHDVAEAISVHVVEVFVRILRDDEKRDAYEAVFERVKAGLECFQQKQARMEQRMRPSNN